jgi:hypothetical protein
MSPEQFEILAETIAEEEVASFNGQLLEAKDIVPILEFLWEQGVDLTIITEEVVIFLEDEL